MTTTSTAPERVRDLRDDDADGTGAGDEDAGAGGDAGLADGRDTDRQRLAQSGGIVGHGVRNGMREGRPDGDVLAQRAVDRRRGVEAHVRAQVVVAAARLLGERVGTLRLDRDPLADPALRNTVPDRDHDSGRLVAEHDRIGHDELADPPFAVVVRVRAAHSHGGHPDEDVAGLRCR